MAMPPESDVCSICHARFRVPCQANCSHWFCGNCILQVWEHGGGFHPCKCPLCRREITLLVPTGVRRGQQMANVDVVEILLRIERYNSIYGQRPNGLMQRTQDLPFLLRRLSRDMMDTQRSLPLIIRARVILAMVVGALYVISPIDLIPEGLLGIFGLLDDLIILFVCFLHIAALYRAYLHAHHGGAYN